MKFEIEIGGVEATKYHLRERQDKYVAAFTNIQNLKELVKGLKKEALSAEDIKAMDELIKGGDESLIEARDKAKQIAVVLEQNEQQIRDNEQAIRLYKKNIQFLQNNLIIN